MTQPDVVLADQCVVISDGRITAIREDGQCAIPDGATETRGGWLIPGLAEMHAHVPTPEHGEHAVADVLTLMLVNGITTARGMLGAPSHLQLRDQLQQGALLGPNLVTSGPSINGNSAPDPDTAEAMVRAQHAAGYDFLKLHAGLSTETFDRLVLVANELDIPFAGHVSLDVGLERSLVAGQASIEHLDGFAQLMIRTDDDAQVPNPAFFGFNLGPWFDPQTILPLAERVAASDSWVVPTQTLIENVIGAQPVSSLAARPEMRYASDGQLNEWAAAKTAMVENPLHRKDLAQRFIDMRRAMIGALNAAGAKLLLGADAPQIYNVPGFALHRELQLMVASGLTPWQALQTGTANVARFLGAEDEFGTIQVGLRADLVLLKDNPLDDIKASADAAGVMINGRWLPEVELQALLDALEQRLRS